MFNVGANKLKTCLIDSFEKNSKALDFVYNQIPKFEDNLKFNENDVLSKEALENLQYIKLILEHTGNCYSISLRRLNA